MKSKKGVGFLVLCIMFLCTTLVEATLTIATFEDPAEDSSTFLFTVDLTNNPGTITGEWDEPGLSLYIPYSGQTFPDVIFTMDPVDYSGDIMGGPTGDGIIKFFEDDTSTAPLIQIDFDSATISPIGFGGLFSFNYVTITIGDTTLTDEAAFAFSFANQVPLNDDWDDGFTATAAFTSSAVPEPATLALLGIGGLVILNRKRRSA